MFDRILQGLGVAFLVIILAIALSITLIIMLPRLSDTILSSPYENGVQPGAGIDIENIVDGNQASDENAGTAEENDNTQGETTQDANGVWGGAGEQVQNQNADNGRRERVIVYLENNYVGYSWSPSITHGERFIHTTDIDGEYLGGYYIVFATAPDGATAPNLFFADDGRVFERAYDIGVWRIISNLQ